MGYKRVGCWPCVMANQRDILNIAQQAPERIDYIAKIEQELQCGDRLRSEFSARTNTCPRNHQRREISDDS